MNNPMNKINEVKEIVEDIVLDKKMKNYYCDNIENLLKCYSADFCDIMLNYYPGASIMMDNNFRNCAILIRNNLYNASGLINRANYFLITEEELNYIRKGMPHLSDTLMDEVQNKIEVPRGYTLRKSNLTT